MMGKMVEKIMKNEKNQKKSEKSWNWNKKVMDS